MNKIDNFMGEYRFLSNFWMSPVEMKRIVYPSVEHAYQAAKTFDKKERKIIEYAITPGQAKKLGKKLVLREDWEKVKIPIMKELVKRKFKDSTLKALLKKTGDKELIEGNTWGDTFWGICKGIGENHLGKILMEVRKTL